MFDGLEDVIETNIWPFSVTLTLNAVIHFFHRTLWLLMVYHQTKFGCQGTNSSENIIERVIFWLYEPLTLKMATTTKCPHDSGSWCCITIPTLVTKCFVIQKILSRQTFTDILNLLCDLDLDRSNPIFSQNTPAYDAVLSNQVWLQTDLQFRRCNRNSHILII